MAIEGPNQVVWICRLIWTFSMLICQRHFFAAPLCLCPKISYTSFSEKVAMQTIQTHIRLLLKGQANLGLCCLPLYQHTKTKFRQKKKYRIK